MFNKQLPSIALISDVHGNLEALSAVLADIARQGIEYIGFLGDAVGYGPDPLACLDALKDRCDFMLGGNHDRAAVTGEGLEHMGGDARQAVSWTADRLPEADKAFLEDLPLVHRMGPCLFAHGCPVCPVSFDYVLSVSDSKTVFLNHPERFICVGHTHVPAVFVEVAFKRMFAGLSHRVVRKEITDVHADAAKRYLVNNGSVGQPRDGDPRASYGVLDLDAGRWTLKRVGYDIDAVVKKMRRAGLSEGLATRLYTGE